MIAHNKVETAASKRIERRNFYGFKESLFFSENAVHSDRELKLQTPELVKQGSRYGVKLKAVASSIHMLKVDVESTFEPIIGSEIQSKELIDRLMKDYESDASSIWKSEIFGRSLEAIVQEGIQAKLSMMPDNTRYKLKETVSKIVNKGSNTLIAIVI